jgi:hypothetical protein
VCRLLAVSTCLGALFLTPVATASAQDAPAVAAPQPGTRSATTTSGQPAGADRLPVRRVVLYKSGVGYFEHLGRVRGNQTVSIDLTSGQLDDVLKSLTTVDLGDGRVTGITFNSTAPLEQRMRTLSIPLGAGTSRASLLQAMRGARVEVQGSGASTIGRVLSVSERVRTLRDTTESVDELTLVTDAGAVRTFELREGVGVRLLEADLRSELGQYLDLIGSTRAQDVRRLSMATVGTGARDLFVSYVSEVPVWKTTYRLVIPPDITRKPFLQGWAVVDNTLGEDWTDVQLSLVAGAPQSFVQPLSQPLYTRRPVVPIATGALTTPQTHGATMTTSEKAVDAAFAADAAPQLNATRRERSAVPGGALGGVVGGLPSAPPPAPAAAEIAVRLSEMEAAASGADLGDLFEYKLTEPVTIRRNQSALVPIVQADITVERVSLWNAASAGGRPLRALWLTNDTGLTLDGGSLSLVEGGAFAGEGLLEPIKAGERRFISYATDLASRVTANREGGPRRISRVRIASGTMTQFVEERASTTYTVRNEDAAPRDVIIEHPIRDGWTLSKGTAAPVESTATQHRFRVTVPPGASASLKVDEVHPIETRVAVTNLNNQQVALVLRGRNLDPSIEPQLQAVLAASREVARLQAESTARRAEVERIGQDQARIRENLEALKGSAEERQLVARYTRQLNEQEDRLDVLRREIESLEGQVKTAQQELARLAGAVTLDVELP